MTRSRPKPASLEPVAGVVHAALQVGPERKGVTARGRCGAEHKPVAATGHGRSPPCGGAVERTSGREAYRRSLDGPDPALGGGGLLVAPNESAHPESEAAHRPNKTRKVKDRKARKGFMESFGPAPSIGALAKSSSALWSASRSGFARADCGLGQHRRGIIIRRSVP